MAAKRAVLAKKRVALVRSAVRAMTGLELPDALIVEVAGSDAELLAELAAAEGSLDTEVRELFQEALAQHLTGCSWPLIGEANRPEEARRSRSDAGARKPAGPAPRRQRGARSGSSRGAPSAPPLADAALDAIRAAVEARGGSFVPPVSASPLAFGVRALDGGVFQVVVRGRVDETNATRLGDAVIRAVLRKAPGTSPAGLRIALDVSGLEAGETEALMIEALERVVASVVTRGKGAVIALGSPAATRVKGLRFADSLQHAVASLRG